MPAFSPPSGKHRVPSQCAISDGVRRCSLNLAAINADVPQLPLVETAQDGQVCLMCALGEDGRNPSIDQLEKSSANGADRRPNV
jgi:hypothetical protein